MFKQQGWYFQIQQKYLMVMCIFCTPFYIFQMAVQKSHRSKSKITFRKKLTIIKLKLNTKLKKNTLKYCIIKGVNVLI